MTKQSAEMPRLESKTALGPDEIVELLKLIGGSDTPKKLVAALGDARFSMRAITTKTLLDMRPAPTQSLIEALSDHNSIIRGKAAELLGQLGDPYAVQPLICRLQDPEWYVRGKAAEALGRLKDRSAVEALVAIICADDKVFMLAAKALQEIPDNRSMKLLADALLDDDPGVRRRVTGALNLLDNSFMIDFLMIRIKSDDHDLSRKAARALVHVGDVRVVDRLLVILNKNSDTRIRQEAMRALEKIRDTHIESLLDALHNKESQVRKLAEIYCKHNPELQALSGPHLQDAITMMIIRDLGQLRDIRAVRPLFELSGHQNTLIYKMINHARAMIREANEERLLADLNGQDLLAQAEAAELLGLLAVRKAIGPLLNTLRSPNKATRVASAEALALIEREQAVEPLRSALREEHDEATYRKIEKILSCIQKDSGTTGSTSSPKSTGTESAVPCDTAAPDVDVKLQVSRRAYKKSIFKQPLFLTMVAIFLIIILITVGTIRHFSSLTPASTSSSYPFSRSLVFSDSLKNYNGDHGWDIRKFDHSLCVFFNGAYHAYSAASSPAICIARSTVFRNFTYEVQMKLVSGDFGGIIFRYIEPQRAYFYAFGISQEGRYIILPSDPQPSSKEVEGQSPAIATGYNQSNLLAVVASGKALRFYINGHEITEITGGTINQGSIGVFALDIVNPTEAQFSNAKVWKLPD